MTNIRIPRRSKPRLPRIGKPCHQDIQNAIDSINRLAKREVSKDLTMRRTLRLVAKIDDNHALCADLEHPYVYENDVANAVVDIVEADWSDT